MSCGRAAPGICRETLAERTLLVLRRGRGTTPDVLLVETDGGRAIVKDGAPRTGRLRSRVARWRLGREMRALAALADVPEVPALLGAVDRDAFAVEHRPGSRFSRARPWLFGPEFQEGLETAVARLHARGVAHLDLSHRSNVRADLAGRPVVIDLGASVCVRPGGWAARLVLPLLAVFDRRALRKWRARTQGAGRGSGATSDGGRGARRPT